MIILIAFAFLAGIVTILSPCILPILPIVLSTSLSGGHRRPFGVVIGFIASFTFFTLFLATIVKLTGVSADALRMLSVIVIFLFGISLLIPRFQMLVEKLFSKLASRMPQQQQSTGFWGGLLIGLSLGLLWTPCVGPILASVISLALTGTINGSAVFITLAYSLGTAIPLFAILIGGRNLLQKVPWLLRNSAKIQKLFGVLMICVALGIFFNFDRSFQMWVLKTFPQYGAGLTKFEENSQVQNQLKQIDMPDESLGNQATTLDQLQKPLAPQITAGGQWFNSEPLILEDLKGKVVLIDFWTYSCINCIRTLPYLREWNEKYKDKGLVIIGVHTPEFEFEKSPDNVAQAIKDFGITYPVVQDNNFSTWNAYNNRYWPAKYFIDKSGRVRSSHFGEGAYDESEKLIQELLNEGSVEKVSNPISNPQYDIKAQTPELYLGYGRIEYLANRNQLVENEDTTYTYSQTPPSNYFSYNGTYMVGEEYANPKSQAILTLNFTSQQVFLVVRPKSNQSQFKVYLDGKGVNISNQGEDVKNGIVTVNKDRLYKLIKLEKPGNHILKLEFLDDNSEIFAFTFG